MENMNVIRICTRLTWNYKHAVKQMITAAYFTLFLLSANAQVTQSLDSTYFDLSLEELQKIKVKSASFFESDILTVGSSVSVIERADWDRKGVRRTLEAIVQEPSVMLLTTTSGRDVIAVRGYGQLASARGIATLIDGIAMNGPYFGSGQYMVQNVNLGVLDRIEVIRGPGSALYGTDAFHGVLSMTTFESEEDLTRVSIEGGTDHYYQGSLQYSVGLGDHARLDLAFGASGEDRDRSYQALDLYTLSKAEFNPDEHYQSQTGSLKLTVNPTSRLKIKGGFLVDNYDAYNYPQYTTVSEATSTSETLAGQLSATQSFVQGRTLEARIHHMRNHSPRSATRLDRALGVVYQENSSREERTGATLTFRQPETERWRTEYAVSLGFERMTFLEGPYTQIPVDPSIPPVQGEIGGVGQHRDITHLVLDSRTILDDHWSMIYGGRVDHYSDVATQATPRVGIVFQPINNTAIKLIYQQAFRAPTFGEQYSVAPLVFNLDPEILDSYEIIFLKEVANWKAEFVVFQNDWKDGIVLRVDPSSPVGYLYENSGKNQSRGIEATLGWHPVQWRVDLSGSYVQSTNLKADQDYDLFPPIMINAGIGRTLESLGLELFLNNRYFNGAQDIAYNATLLGTPEDLPAYWRTDFNMTKHFASGMDLIVNIINLFDRDNRVPSILGLPGGVEDHSLSVSARVRYTF